MQRARSLTVDGEGPWGIQYVDEVVYGVLTRHKAERVVSSDT